jgi:hypothetical protein
VIELRYEMTFTERIEGPLGPTTSGRLCWQIAEATLTGPRIEAALALPAPTGSTSTTKASAGRISARSSSPRTGPSSCCATTPG